KRTRIEGLSCVEVSEGLGIGYKRTEESPRGLI
ncbi:LOW QUALITY PROTEIN: uncharacterized protein LOC111209454, partial [Brassica napus]